MEGISLLMLHLVVISTLSIDFLVRAVLHFRDIGLGWGTGSCSFFFS